MQCLFAKGRARIAKLKLDENIEVEQCIVDHDNNLFLFSTTKDVGTGFSLYKHTWGRMLSNVAALDLYFKPIDVPVRTCIDSGH